MGSVRHRSKVLKGAQLTALAAALLVVGLVSFHPWAVTALREGFPSDTWPAAGHFTTRGPADEAVALPANRLEATDPFRQEFARSEASAVVMMEGGEIVYSDFEPGLDADTLFNSYSMAKSLVGVLALVALSDGTIPGLDTTVGQLWPEAETTAVGPVTVRELLDMRSGLAFEKDPGQVGGAGASGKSEQAFNYGPFSDMARLHVEGLDRVVGDVQLVAADRGRYSYQNLNTAVLARVVEEVRGRPIDELVYDTLAEPAGAGGFRWRQYSESGAVSPYCCLYATAQWWARVGSFVLHNGGATPLLSAEWHRYLLGDDLTVEQRRDGEYRSQLHYDVLDREGEALQGPFVYFSGLGGQITYLVPGADLVVVRFGHQLQLLHSTLYAIAQFEPAPG